ncbi:MAG TPA: metallophosphoesterase [Verrucomicrobiae bacterium]|nr:metallophosphoesterase [Verrucomicrobiae bacterium]
MPDARVMTFAIMCALSLTRVSAAANDAQSAMGRGHHTQGGTNVFNVAVPAHAYDLILARPEKNSVTLSALAYQDMETFVSYGTKSGVYPAYTPVQELKRGAPVELVIGPLQANTQYYYQLCSRAPGAADFAKSPEYTFHTARPPGSSFTFTLTADSHLDERTSPEVYRQTLGNIRADEPDFHIDLGNLFMTDKHASRDEAAAQYLAQRYYLGQIGCSTPILLALGTHDGEAAKDNDGSADCLAAWSNRMRTRYFPNPAPDDFYSRSGPLQNYYAFEWGDALFVVLDPFRYSARQHGGGDGWGWSLGQPQYGWLERTLENSRATFKFVFIHNLLCGDQAARGGVEVAGFNEWGGKNRDGSDGFKEHRPGWAMPVHQLLVRNHVAVVFKAHDNFYARQQLDGIVYTMVPQPSFAGIDRIRDLDNYGYKQGTFLGNSGHVRVTVSPEKVALDYLRASPDREVVDSHVIPAKSSSE